MPFIMKRYYPWRNLLFILGEGGLIFFIINGVFASWTGFRDFSDFLPMYISRALVATIAFQLSFYYFDLYDCTIIPAFSDHMLKVTQTFGIGCILLACLYYFFPSLIISTKVFWSGLIAVGVVIFIWRFFYFQVLENRMFAKPIALIGTGRLGREIASAINNKKDSGYKIIAAVGDKNPQILQGTAPFLGDIKDLRELCQRRSIEKIVLALDERRGRLPMHDLIQYKFMGIEIVDALKFFEEITGKIIVEQVNPSWMLFSEGFYIRRLTRVSKRFLDVIAASTLLMLALPLFALSALIIKLETPGGIFYCQERVGKNGRVFKIIKFRSMREDAEQNGPVWAAAQDDRITRYGRFIRRTRMDELPQLLNVLAGDMSFVGPRPERPVFVNELIEKIPFYSIRHVLKPGITGWAQINYPYGASIEDTLHKLEYDIYYIKNLSIGMDLVTIFRTIKVVLFRKGAR